MSSQDQPIQDRGCLAVVVPCFNEEATLKALLDRVFASPHVGEVIAVDDCSTDATPEILRSYNHPDLRVLHHSVNQGKGAALRSGFSLATRPFVIVQDADLEYDPADYGRVLGPLLNGSADVVYGSRFRKAQGQRVLSFWHTVGNRVLTLCSNTMTDLNLTDMETCYKAFRREVIQSISIEEDRFGFEPEVTAKIAARKLRVAEVSISYHGRNYAEGKKIGWKDGVRALYCVVAYSPLGERYGIARLGRLLRPSPRPLSPKAAAVSPAGSSERAPVDGARTDGSGISHIVGQPHRESGVDLSNQTDQSWFN